ncbi:hypothetical protein [Chania multitudinisentens]|uniref:hypothetical protein n=1 Tax=Chania multitudinisentens TaxID=1639108 RepID=UPI0012B52F1C|nr:hypothetical protein [Chania multitudinisentens]
MPILFLLLGERVGFELTLALALQHVLVKYRDDTGTCYNTETTSGGGFARDSWVRQQMPMSDLAIQTGIYLRSLSKREVAIVMMDLLNEHYSQLGFDHERIALAELLKQHDTAYINGTLHIASASQRLWHLHSNQSQSLQTTYHYLENVVGACYRLLFTSQVLYAIKIQCLDILLAILTKLSLSKSTVSPFQAIPTCQQA